jgi:hypothetical protein
MKVLKYFYFLLLIENIKNNENKNLSLDNSSNYSSKVNIFEMNDIFNENHIGIELNLSSFDYIEQDYLFFFHKFEHRNSKVGTFRLEFEYLSLNDSINDQIFGIKCMFTDININLSYIDIIHNLKKFSSSGSNCIGSFDLNKKNKNKNKNKFKYNGIYKTENETDNGQKIIFMIKNNWNLIKKVNLYLRTNIDNLLPNASLLAKFLFSDKLSLIEILISFDFIALCFLVVFFSVRLILLTILELSLFTTSFLLLLFFDIIIFSSFLLFSSFILYCIS